MTTRTERLRAATSLLCALALLGAACSSSRVNTNPTAEASDSRSEPDGSSEGKKGKKGKGKGKNAAGKAVGEAAPDDPGAAAAAGDGDPIAPGGLASLGPGGPEFARKSAHEEEPKPDAESGGPLKESYAEAMELDVDGLGEDFRVTFTMNGQVPEKFVTPNTIMVVAFGMSGETENGGYAFGAQGRENGWSAYAGAKNKTEKFPGTFFIKGNKIEFTVPWSFVGGPRPFEYYASASWFRGTGEQNTTSYSFDVIPNGKGRYPN